MPSLYRRALKFAHRAHKNQTRRQSNVPYLVHPVRVASAFNDDARKAMAVLHDVVEDTDVTIDDLRKKFPAYVVVAVEFLTRRKDETHFDYIRRVREHEVATEIKIVDIIDNLSDCLSPETDSMVDRYVKSLDILLNKKAQ